MIKQNPSKVAFRGVRFFWIFILSARKKSSKHTNSLKDYSVEWRWWWRRI